MSLLAVPQAILTTQVSHNQRELGTGCTQQRDKSQSIGVEENYDTGNMFLQIVLCPNKCPSNKMSKE